MRCRELGKGPHGDTYRSELGPAVAAASLAEELLGLIEVEPVPDPGPVVELPDLVKISFPLRCQLLGPDCEHDDLSTRRRLATSVRPIPTTVRHSP